MVDGSCFVVDADSGSRSCVETADVNEVVEEREEERERVREGVSEGS